MGGGLLKDQYCAFCTESSSEKTMKEQGKDVRRMKEGLPISCEVAREKPNYQKTSGMLLTACRSFFQKDENEKAYQEWKARKEGKAG